MGTSNYWKAVISNYIMLFVTIILFFNCMCTGVRGTESNTPTKLIIAALAIVIGLLFNFFLNTIAEK